MPHERAFGVGGVRGVRGGRGGLHRNRKLGDRGFRRERRGDGNAREPRAPPFGELKAHPQHQQSEYAYRKAVVEFVTDEPKVPTVIVATPHTATLAGAGHRGKTT